MNNCIKSHSTISVINYFNSLFADGGICVQESMGHLWKDLIVDHLWLQMRDK